MPNYAIIDIETTGGLYKRDKITEIAIVITDGQKIIDQYDTLVNPGISIPPNITRITGITNEMVVDAPPFYEIAKKVVEFTKDCIFVAHNVQFDYSFIQNEFSSLGYSFSMKRLCTVKLSRKSFPKLNSHSLGNLIRHFKIEVANRHRALDDALATTIIFHKIFKLSDGLKESKFLMQAIDTSKLPEGITKEFINGLPSLCGVYYMLDAEDEIVYIGKSINIKKRIKQHFSKVDKKTGTMLQKVRKITYELTGSELISLLKEANEIHTFNPSINRALKKKEYPYCIIYYENKQGYIALRAKKINEKILNEKNILSHHTSLASAKNTITQYSQLLFLCKKINHIEKSNSTHSPCFEYTVGTCLGACIREEEVNSYNERVNEVLESEPTYDQENFFIIDKGRTSEEKAIILIEDGNYKGYGFINIEDTYLGSEELKECIEYIESNSQFDKIIKSYLSHHYLETIAL